MNILKLFAFVGGISIAMNLAANEPVTMPVLGLEPTGKAPVVYVETENRQIIDQKDTYIPSKIWIDGVVDGFEDLASEAKPLDAGIRGRGNSSWKYFLKKPYKIKFDKKQTVLGMSKSKHWALTHFMGGNGAYYSDPLGRYISDLVGLSWAPKVKIVELVLNGDYLGMYFMCETIKIAKDRLNIAEQPEGNTDLATIADGWLVEFDNYTDENQILVPEGPLVSEGGTEIDPTRGNIKITVKNPDNMTSEQEKWVRSQWEAINLAIYNPDKTSTTWEKYIDKESVARYFIVNQIMFNVEAWSGSCYWHRDAGNDAKWTAGPVWDISIGEAVDFVYNIAESLGPYRVSLMDELIKFPAMRKAVMDVWKDFIDPANGNKDKVFQFLKDWEVLLSEVEPRNKEVWPGYYASSTSASMLDYASVRIKKNFQFLETALGNGTGEGNFSALEEILTPNTDSKFTVVGGNGVLSVRMYADAAIGVYKINGVEVERTLGKAGDVIVMQLEPGVYVVTSGDTSKKIIVR